MNHFFNIFIKIFLLFLWIWGHQSTLLWIAEKAENRFDFLFLTTFLISLLIFSFYKIRKSRCLYTTYPACTLFILAAAGSLINDITLKFNQFDMSFLILGIYAWLGLSKEVYPKWQKLLNSVLLISFLLPFYLEFSSGFGFSLRLITASIIENFFTLIGIKTISSHDIIIIENSIAHIDIPCSGLKSLWMGNVFFLAVIIALRIKLSLNVLWKYLLFIFLLFSANAFRILLLTTLTSIYNLNDFARMIHVPLGATSFLFCCIIASFLLIKESLNNKTEITYVLPNKFQTLYFINLLILIVLQISLNLNEKYTYTKQNLAPINMPATLNLTEIELSKGETLYFSKSNKTIAQKWKGTFEKDKGELLIVQSYDLNMFHAPELCMAANGFIIDKMKTINFNDNHKIRILSLNNGEMTGLYWLQSDKICTDDFKQRYWYYLLKHKKNWKLVFILLNKTFPSNYKSINIIAKQYYNIIKMENLKDESF